MLLAFRGMAFRTFRAAGLAYVRRDSADFGSGGAAPDSDAGLEWIGWVQVDSSLALMNLNMGYRWTNASTAWQRGRRGSLLQISMPRTGYSCGLPTQLSR